MENRWNNIDQQTMDELAADLEPIAMLRERLHHNEKNKISQTIENCELVVREDPLLKNAVRVNMMTGRMEIQKPMPWKRAGVAVTDNDMDNLLSYMARNYDQRNDRLCRRAISTAAHENSYHPVRDLLDTLVWDGQPRIRHALHHFLGGPEDELAFQCMKMYMIGAMLRIYKPGCKFEYVLTLVGGQGLGKSTFFRFLALRDEWFTDDLVGFKSSRIFEKISGHWIIEMSEMLAIMNAKGADETKSFLSRQSDVYRDPYAIFPNDRPRQCVFGATTNRSKCLPFDRTGNRRFLPIAVDQDKAEVHILEDEQSSRAYFAQMWAEAMVMFRSGNYALKFPKEIERQLETLRRGFMAEDTNAGLIQAFLDRFSGDIVCTTQIYREALGNPFGEPRRADSIEIADIMRNAVDGWKEGPVHRFGKYGTQRSWVRVPLVSERAAKPPLPGSAISEERRQPSVNGDCKQSDSKSVFPEGFKEMPDDPDNPFAEQPIQTAMKLL